MRWTVAVAVAAAAFVLGVAVAVMWKSTPDHPQMQRPQPRSHQSQQTQRVYYSEKEKCFDCEAQMLATPTCDMWTCPHATSGLAKLSVGMG